MKNHLGRNPGRTLQRIGAALFGLWLTNIIIDFIWEKPDQVTSRGKSIATLQVNRPLDQSTTVLIIGSKESHYKDKSFIKPYLISHLTLLKFTPNKKINALLISPKIAINLPGEEGINQLSYSYYKGGISLVSDVINEIINDPAWAPKRYLILSHDYLNGIKDELTSLSPELIKILSSNKVKLNFSDNRSTAFKISISKIVNDLNDPSKLKKLLKILTSSYVDLETDLSKNELISLAAAGLNSSVLELSPLSSMKNGKTNNFILMNADPLTIDR